MNLQTEQKLFVASFAAIALLGGLVVVSAYNIYTNQELNNWVTHTYKVQAAISTVSSLIINAETSERGFLLTTQDRFLEPYNEARDHLPEELNKLKQLVQDKPAQEQAAVKLEAAIISRMTLLEKIIDHHRHDPDVSRDAASIELGRLEMDKIRLLTSAMSDREERLLAERTEAQDESQEQVNFFTLMSLAAIFIVALVIYWQLYHIVTRRRESDALRKSETRFRKIADKIPSILWQLDPEGNPLFVNRAWYEYTGCTPDQYAKDGGAFYVHPDDWPKVIESRRESIAQRKQWEGKFRIRRHDGEYGWFLAHGIPLFSQDGKLECFIGQTMEITELQRIEEALSAESQKLIVTLNSIGDGVVTTDMEGRVFMLNREGESLTGWTQKEAIGHPLSEVFKIVHQYSRLPIEDPVQKVLRTGTTVELANHTLLISRDGVERIIADSAAPIRDTQGKILGTVLVFRDSTQKEKLTEEMLRSSKLESLGLLAGGIAHDFNNLLSTVLGNITVLERFSNDTVNVPQCLAEARLACMRARDLTQQLLTFSKGGAPIKKLAHLKEVITESTRFALHGSSVRAEFDIAPDLYTVNIDSSQISQVIHNIVLNAAQAMPHGGTINVKAFNIPDISSGKVTRISISDNGVGISPDDLPKIFDPYFTTKASGTGLGLASSYSIVKKHEGEITVDSKVGVGSTFHVDLPAHDAKEQEIVTPKETETIVTGQGRLLVLEDERMLSRLLKIMLGNLGYEVSVAHTGSQAIELYRESMTTQMPFDGCILDLTLAGGMSGAETFLHLRKMNPTVRALVCSGYSNDQILADFRNHGFSGIIVKPYTIEDISQAVQKMLDAKEA